jgi:hypothetical protein
MLADSRRGAEEGEDTPATESVDMGCSCSTEIRGKEIAMHKRITGTVHESALQDNDIWLNLEDLVAEVEITSEAAEHPVESALAAGRRGAGWRAGQPGKQMLRLLFSQPQTLHRIHLEFIETSRERTQEHALRWSSDGGRTFREIVRQQWNFSPNGATEETEDYRVALAGATLLELVIVPDISGGDAVATLSRLCLA